MLEARQGAAYTGENMTPPESPAILYEHADGRRAVVSANRVATFAIDNPDWHRAGPVEIVWVDEAAPAWRPIETAPKDAQYVLLRGKREQDVASGYWLQSAYAGNGAWIWPFVHRNPILWAPLQPSPSSADEGGGNG